ncbi:calcium/proton exchanger [Cyphellophora europaea CBS 101466]|uniref:Calcium/proton exchanger n=1 Tax=Cyphellophora europaea (strain CBS 101466) TaxID=1220924 RepID=W2S0M7_CYPE1|nr:calcium/proton exchanger [Cyphellophora europaea CBS 101466]ETN42232.1 calcium/proton exchanger [Cyphellophora europaea CBS 101466]
MHSIKHRAKQAGYYSDGSDRNFNPFAKYRSNSSKSTRRDEENGLRPVRTTHNDQGTEQRRDELVGHSPKHADTSPTAIREEKHHAGGDIDIPRSSSPTNEVNGLSASPEKTGAHENGDAIVGGTRSASEQDGLKRREGGRKGLLGGIFKHSTSDSQEADRDSTGKDKANKHHKFTVGNQLRAVLFNSWINILLIASPVGIALHFAKVQPIAIFVVNFIAIIPLAALLSYATEEIALRTGEVIGGLLNASFGNAVELIVSIIALVKDQTLIVQTSLIGSMLSNLLLVLGMCFFFGGVNRLEQNFNITVAQTASSLLFLSVSSLLIPTAFDEFARIGDQSQASGDPSHPKPHVADLSRGTAIMLLIVYGCYLFFQLKSHVKMFSEVSEKTETRNVGGKLKNTFVPDRFRHHDADGAVSSNAVREAEEEEEDEGPEEPNLSVLVAILTLCGSTVLVALNAEFLVDSINEVTCGGGISKNFVGLILLPIVGNAAEHATAVTVAIKDKMDLAIGVAVGSSMQIALLVLPLVVVLGWIIGKDDMTLFFDGFQITVLFVSVLLVNYLIQDGKSHWLEGVLLMTLYVIIAVAAWFCKFLTHSRPTNVSKLTNLQILPRPN